MTSGFFNVRGASDFFGILTRTLESYRSAHEKRVEDLLLLVLGFAHLSDWIAPGFNPNDKKALPQNAAERFVVELSNCPSYQTVRQLSNHAKHQRRSSLPQTQTTKHVDLWDDRKSPIDSWLDVDAGSACEYEYGDRDLLVVFDEVAGIYRTRWFSLPIEQRLSCAAADIACGSHGLA